MLNPRATTGNLLMETVSVNCNFVISAAVTATLGLMSVAPGTPQPIAVSLRGEITLGFADNFRYTPPASTSTVGLRAFIFNLQVYPKVCGHDGVACNLDPAQDILFRCPDSFRIHM
jgi:hypothetical protein